MTVQKGRQFGGYKPCKKKNPKKQSVVFSRAGIIPPKRAPTARMVNSENELKFC